LSQIAQTTASAGRVALQSAAFRFRSTNNISKHPIPAYTTRI